MGLARPPDLLPPGTPPSGIVQGALVIGDLNTDDAAAGAAAATALQADACWLAHGECVAGVSPAWLVAGRQRLRCGVPTADQPLTDGRQRSAAPPPESSCRRQPP